MTKLEVQQRVLKNGKPLELDLFNWDETSNTLYTTEDNLCLDFNDISGCTFTTGSECTFKTHSDCTFTTGSDCAFVAGYNCTFDTGADCNFTTGSECTFNTDSGCTFMTRSRCTFDTGSECTFKTGSRCTFKTGSSCTFKTSSDCTFGTGYNCTFMTGSECTFDTGYECVIVRSDIHEVIQPDGTEKIILNPYNIRGFISKLYGETQFYLNRDKSLGEHIIVDNILSTVISRKGNVIKVINFNETTETYIVTDGDNYSHGSTIKEAKALLYKYNISSRDESLGVHNTNTTN